MVDNISSVYGFKQTKELEEIDHTFEAQDGIVMRGWMSKPGEKMGRGKPDRQHFYINGRPCDLAKVAKVLNKAFASFSSHKRYPMFALDFTIPKEAVDVNVTPDKRTIFMHHEKQLLEALKAYLEEKWEPHRFTF